MLRGLSPGSLDNRPWCDRLPDATSMLTLNCLPALVLTLRVATARTAMQARIMADTSAYC